MNVEDNFPCPGCSQMGAWTINQIREWGTETLGQEDDKHLPHSLGGTGKRRDVDDW